MNMTDGLRQILVCAVFGVSLLLLAYFLSNKLYKHLKKKEDKRREFIDSYLREHLEKKRKHRFLNDEQDRLDECCLKEEAKIEDAGTHAGDAKKDVTETQEEVEQTPKV